MRFFPSTLLLLLLAESSVVQSFAPHKNAHPATQARRTFSRRYLAPLPNNIPIPDIDLSIIKDTLSQVKLPDLELSIITDKLSQLTLPDLELSINALSQLKLATVLDWTRILDKASLFNTLQSLISQISDAVKSHNVDLPFVDKLAQEVNAALSELVSKNPNLQPFVDAVRQQVEPLLHDVPPSLAIGVSAVISFALVNSLLTSNEGPPPSQPYPMKEYDPATARAYYDKHLIDIVSRGFEVSTRSLGFGLSLLQDYANNKMDVNAEQRAIELAKLLTQLGPSFIKVGQSLSIRTDLLSPPYVRGLQTLQDQVPPFSSKIANAILEKEWGRPIDEVVSYISPEPVAAASLGQVYKATLLENGQEVAIKVQRPNIMNQIALDMHLLREVAPIAKATFNLNTDIVGTVDAWGAGFVAELDYLEEARNAQQFTESIQATTLKDVVFAPTVLEDYSTSMVLTTEWVDGERLDKSSSEDVTVLCSIAMNSYLTMMLETGLLHCDPHPGNLLRTPDGRLCVLDWGMVTRLDKDLQLTLIEHMAHLTSGDYAEIPRDLLLLDFIPQDKAEFIEDSGVVEVLADIYGAWTSGGGAASINVNEVVTQLQDLTATRGNLFQIPPYFAYIAKSFSVLEGIGLSNDPNYSIINECLPYVSKRLLTDQSERTGGALSTFIFGPDKANVVTRIVDYDRVEQLVTGFGNYTTSASGALLGKEDLSRTQMLEQAADQLFDLILTEKETPLQTIFLEQLAKIVTASSRSIWAELRERSGTLPSGRTVLGTLVDPLGFWRTSPLVRMNAQDERTVHTTQKLISLMQKQIQDNKNPIFDVTSLSREETLELSSILGRKVWSRRGGLLRTGNRFAKQLLTLTADKLERGERDTIRIPESRAPEQQAAVEVEARPVVHQARPSARLENARRMLSELQETHAPVMDNEVEEEVVEFRLVKTE